MTDKYDERAEDITKYILAVREDNACEHAENISLCDECIVYSITHRIAAALREVVEENEDADNKLYQWNYNKGKAEAYADAAKIVHKRWERLRLSPTILQVELLQLEQVEEDLRARAQEVQP